MPIYMHIYNLIKETINAWQKDRVTTLAASLAYYAIFSLAPMLILIVLLVGQVLDANAIDEEIVNNVRTTIGEEPARILSQIVENRDEIGGSFLGAILWGGVMIWGATGLFVQLQNALNIVWQATDDEKDDMSFPLGLLKSRALSFGIVLLVAVLLLMAMIINTGVSIVVRYVQGLADLAFVIQPLQLLLSVVVLTALFAVIFKTLPDKHITWRNVGVGSLLTAILFFIGQFLVGLYFSYVDVGSVFGAAGSLTAVLVWIYYSAQILLFGAEFTKVWGNYWDTQAQASADDSAWYTDMQQDARIGPVPFGDN